MFINDRKLLNMNSAFIYLRLNIQILGFLYAIQANICYILTKELRITKLHN